MSTLRPSEPGLLVTTSPFLKDDIDTARIMWEVSASLAPVVVGAAWLFGPGTLLLLASAVAGSVLPEWLYGQRSGRRPLRDGSAVLTGLLLGLTLPPALPLWMAFLGGLVAVLVGKLIFGGIGGNVFNPALVGRAFLQAAFPAALTSWVMPGAGFQQSVLALPLTRPEVDAISSATPLAQMKFGGEAADWTRMALGEIPGSLGETSAVLVLVCGGYLVVRGIVNWRIPVAIFLAVFAAGELLHALNPAHPSGAFHLAAGGLVLGAMYMATDPVTSPITQAGCWVFGAGIGLLVVVIRVWGGLPEGVMYAILFMNALSPIISRLTQPRTFGTRFKPEWKR